MLCAYADESRNVYVRTSSSLHSAVMNALFSTSIFLCFDDLILAVGCIIFYNMDVVFSLQPERINIPPFEPHALINSEKLLSSAGNQ